MKAVTTRRGTGQEILLRAAVHAGLLISVCCGVDRDDPCGAVLGIFPVAKQNLAGLSHGLCQEHERAMREQFRAARRNAQ